MITTKQRAKLRSMANGLDSILHIGKGGITENVVKQAQDALLAHELIKVTVQKGSELGAREACEILAEKIEAQPVQCIGSKFVLYKKNEKEPKITL